MNYLNPVTATVKVELMFELDLDKVFDVVCLLIMSAMLINVRAVAVHIRVAGLTRSKCRLHQFLNITYFTTFNNYVQCCLTHWLT